jgi:hypothetical protein
MVPVCGLRRIDVMKSAKKSDPTSFVLQCLRASSSEELEAFLREYAAQGFEIDWESILNRSGKLLPVLTSRLFACRDVISIPPEIVFRLQATYLETARQNDVMRNEILNLAQACTAAGLPLIFLKGAALLLTIYRGDDAVRMMADFDVLTSREALPMIEEVFMRAGYREDYQRFSAEFYGGVYHPKEYFLEHHNHIIYYKNDLRAELHWSIGPKRSAHFLAQLWECQETVSLAGASINILNASATVLINCYNFDKDFPCCFPAGWVKDGELRERACYFFLFCLWECKEILNGYRDEKDFRELYRLLRVNRSEFDVLSVMALAEKILNLKLPKNIFESLRYNLAFHFFMFWCSLKSVSSVCDLILLREKFRRWVYLNQRPGKIPEVIVRKLCMPLVGYVRKFFGAS